MKKIAILGAAESGVGAAILAQKQGYDVFVSDMGIIKPHYKDMLNEHGINWEEGQHSSEKILDASEIIKSPGIPETAPMVQKILEKGIGVISEIEFAGRYDSAKKVCITGSNGKTTTTELTTVLFQAAGEAAAMALAFGIPLEVIARGLEKTVLPGMRMRKTEHNGAVWLNDAYNANPDSMKASLTWLSGFADSKETILVLGDMGELGKNALREHIKVLEFACERFPLSKIICVGKMMQQTYDVMELVSNKENVTVFASTDEAVSYVRESAVPGKLLFLKASNFMQFTKLEPVAGA